MKHLILLTLILCTAMPPVWAQADAIPPPSTQDRRFSDEDILKTFGWWVGQRLGLGELELSEDELQTLITGLRNAVTLSEPPHDLEEIGEQLETFIRGKQEVFMEKLRQQTLRESIAFLARVKARPSVINRPSGLAYEILTQGEGAKPAANATVRLAYVGKLVDGTIFDESDDVIEIKMELLPPGIAEALQQVNVGSTFRLYLPPYLAFGDEGHGLVPPSAAVIYEIDFREIALDQPPAK